MKHEVVKSHWFVVVLFLTSVISSAEAKDNVQFVSSLTNDCRAVLNPHPLHNAVKTLCIHVEKKKQALEISTIKLMCQRKRAFFFHSKLVNSFGSNNYVTFVQQHVLSKPV